MKKIILLILGIALTGLGNAFSMEADTMLSELAAIKQGINSEFVSINRDISAAAKDLSAADFKSEASRQVLKELIRHRDYIIDCAIIDKNGKIVAVEPEEYSAYEGLDVSAQEHNIALSRDQKPVLSGVYRASEGVFGIDFAYPIFSASGEFLGSVSMLVKQEALTAGIINPIIRGLPFKVWIMQKDGLIIYDEDPDQINKNIFSDPSFTGFTQLISFSRTVARSKDGGGSYDFHDKGLTDTTIVQKYAFWDTVSLYGTEWRIISMKSMTVVKKGKSDPGL